jgi:putative ubiquitin-RnfH superfamily antitoxin RatB of RatAB toxin-antitoxin module
MYFRVTNQPKRRNKKMQTKNELAMDIYGVPYVELSALEKDEITEEYRNQMDDDEEDLLEESPSTVDGFVAVEFARPGVNGVKKSVVPEGTTVEEACAQAGFTINKKKEGFTIKESMVHSAGAILSLTDKVNDGDLILIVPGVDSSL